MKENSCVCSKSTIDKEKKLKKFIEGYYYPTVNIIKKHKEWCNKNILIIDMTAYRGIYLDDEFKIIKSNKKNKMVYSDGSPLKGSPMIFYDAVMKNKGSNLFNFIFIEKNKKDCNFLKRIMTHNDNKIEIINQDHNIYLEKIKLSKEQYGFVYCDCTGIPSINTISKLIKHVPRFDVLMTWPMTKQRGLSSIRNNYKNGKYKDNKIDFSRFDKEEYVFPKEAIIKFGNENNKKIIYITDYKEKDPWERVFIFFTNYSKFNFNKFYKMEIINNDLFYYSYKSKDIIDKININKKKEKKDKNQFIGQLTYLDKELEELSNKQRGNTMKKEKKDVFKIKCFFNKKWEELYCENCKTNNWKSEGCCGCGTEVGLVCNKCEEGLLIQNRDIVKVFFNEKWMFFDNFEERIFNENTN